MKGGIIMYGFLLILAVIILQNAAGFVASFLGFTTGTSDLVKTLQGPKSAYKGVSFTASGGKGVALK